jgi:hypothetical protein
MNQLLKMTFLSFLMILVSQSNIGCYKTKILEKEVLVSLQKHNYEFCFEYPTYSSYVIPGGDSQINTDEKVFIILRANPTDKQSEINKWDNKEIKEYGYFVNVTGHKNEYNWWSAKNVEQFKEINCNHLGEVFKRHD